MSNRSNIPYVKEINDEVIFLTKELISLEESNQNIILENECLANELIKNNQEEAYTQNKLNILNNLIILARSEDYLSNKESKEQEYLSLLGDFIQNNTNSNYEMKLSFSDDCKIKINNNNLNIESVEYNGEIKDFKNNIANNLFFLSNMSK
jgi:hypothetical protein